MLKLHVVSITAMITVFCSRQRWNLLPTDEVLHKRESNWLTLIQVDTVFAKVWDQFLKNK